LGVSPRSHFFAKIRIRLAFKKKKREDADDLSRDALFASVVGKPVSAVNFPSIRAKVS